MTQIELRVQRKKMEVVLPAPELHFQTETRCISAPTSPSAAAAFYATLRDIAAAGGNWKTQIITCAAVDGEPKDFDFDFGAAFNFSGKPATPPPLTDADDLFEFGIIRPLKLPPRLSSPARGGQSPKSPKRRGLLSPLRRGRGGKEIDPFAMAMLEATRSRKGSRSLSPLRGKGGFFHTPKSSPSNNPRAGDRRWPRLKDLILFRAPEKREGTKDHLCKYTTSSSSSSSMSSSFRSSVDSGSVMKKKVAFQRRRSFFSQFRLTGILGLGSFNRGKSSISTTQKLLYASAT